jgi:PAS domain S-box
MDDLYADYRLIVDASDDAIITKNLEGVISSWNTGAQRMFGYTAAEAIGQSITIIIPPELHGEEVEILRRLRAGERIEHFETWRASKDGRRINVSVTISPISNAKGEIVGAFKIGRDITARKQTEQALSRVSQKLIEAHEDERKRIARELHDDINQRIALLAATLGHLKQNLPDAAAELLPEIEEAGQQVAEIARDLQSLSHRLHSSKLELLGLKVAAASFCKECSNLQKVDIEFHAENIPQDLSPEIALCLYRVLQEALQNATKHSGTRQFKVSLTGGPEEIELTVQDSGTGFDPEDAIRGQGIGLSSMLERLKLVNGQLLIQSKLQHGTTVQARVPLRLKRQPGNKYRRTAQHS